jgi:NDP-sugar pyrophosphorylase family protein
MNSEFIEDWVKIGYSAREKVQAEHGSKSLDEQCTICEKVRLLKKIIINFCTFFSISHINTIIFARA